MEERRYKTESGTIVYWVSYASHYEESPDTEASLESASEEELAFAPDAAASVMSSQLEKSINKALIPKAPWLVFLPGLTADHRLFNRQLSYFAETMNCFVWDAPAHGKSRPFALTFSMDDLATMLHDILCAEYIENPILIGQSMGGYISQAFLSLFPDSRKDISVSTPLP